MYHLGVQFNFVDGDKRSPRFQGKFQSTLSVRPSKRQRRKHYANEAVEESYPNKTYSPCWEDNKIERLHWLTDWEFIKHEVNTEHMQCINFQVLERGKYERKTTKYPSAHSTMSNRNQTQWSPHSKCVSLRKLQNNRNPKKLPQRPQYVSPADLSITFYFPSGYELKKKQHEARN